MVFFEKENWITGIERLTDEQMDDFAKVNGFKNTEELKSTYDSVNINKTSFMIMGSHPRDWAVLIIEDEAVAYSKSFDKIKIADGYPILLETKDGWFGIGYEPEGFTDFDKIIANCDGPKEEEIAKKLKKIYEKYDIDYIIRHHRRRNVIKRKS